jgi:hypothetical protein
MSLQSAAPRENVFICTKVFGVGERFLMERLQNDCVHFGHATNQDYPIEVGRLGGGCLRGGQ